MFIISLTYTVLLKDIDLLIPQHIIFLDKHYESGCFIASGRKNPRTGGIIIANATSRGELEEVIREDPFYQHHVAEYEITEFIPSKYHENFKLFIED